MGADSVQQLGECGAVCGHCNAVWGQKEREGEKDKEREGEGGRERGRVMYK